MFTAEQSRIISNASGFTSDSRSLKSHEAFIALVGERSDGHEFLTQALSKQPSVLVVQKGHPKLKSLPNPNHIPILEVEDTSQAHRDLAALFRQKFKGTIIAVGGSNGKTTTKDFVATLLSEKFRVMKTEKSQNGELGIPKTLERLTPEFEIGVIEVGIDAPGDMARHSSLVAPDIAILTSIGEEHLNQLKNLETVFTEETVLFHETIRRGGRCFAPENDPYLVRFKGNKSVHLVPARKIPQALTQKYAEQNAGLAAAVAQNLGLTEAQIEAGLQKLSLPDGRGGVRKFKDGVEIITDYYNANPTSMAASIQFAAQYARQQNLPLHFVMGDMADLGERTNELHKSLVNPVNEARPESITLIGPMMSSLEKDLKAPNIHRFATTRDACLRTLQIFSNKGIYLLKGSRVMELETLISTYERLQG